MYKYLRLVFWMGLFGLCTAQALAQAVDTAWVRRFNGVMNSADGGSAIAVGHAGHVYVAGYTGSGSSEDYLTIKYNSNGDTAWVRTYNGTASSVDWASAIAVDNSGRVYVTGSSYNGTNDDYVTIKYHLNGDTAWVRRYNGPANLLDVATAIAIDDSGNVYVTGYSDGSGTSDDYATIKYHPNGDTAWVRRYNGPGNSYDDAYAVAVDSPGNVYVTGYSYGSGTNTDYATVKYQPNGDTAWVRRYNGPGNLWDVAKAMVVDDSGNVYVTGYSFSNSGGNDFATIKYLPKGDTAWVRRYNGPDNQVDDATAITMDGSGNVYVTGFSYGYVTNYDFATIKYLPSGDTAWVRRYNGPGNSEDEVLAIAVDSSRNVYVTGYSYGSGTSKDYATIKYASNGDTAWVARYDGPAISTDSACAVAVDDSGNVYVTGNSVGNSTGMDCVTLKYVQGPSAVEDETESSSKPSEFTLSQNYPNPFNPTTSIKFKVQGSKLKVPVPATLKIYNVLGEKVRILVDEPKLAGDYSIQWDGKNDKGEQLASGVYFYQLKTGDFTSSKKMILLK